MNRKRIAMVLSAVMSFNVLPMNVLAENDTEEEVLLSNEEEGISWNITNDGELIITGNGAMDNYTSEGAPWCAYADQIRTATIASGITSIGDNAFWSCSSLTSINIPDTVERIGEYAFISCRSLESIVIPDGITTLEISTFEDCSELETVTLPDTITTISGSAFSNCGSLKSFIAPDDLTTIGEYAFYGCKSLKNVIIPSTVTTLGASAFANCTGLTSVKISDGLEIINKNTFKGCTSLDGIAIPKSVTYIGSSAFQNCNKLDIVYFAGTETEWDAVAKGSAKIPDNAYICYNSTGPEILYAAHEHELTISGSGNMDVYSEEDHSPWYANKADITKVVIQKGVTSISDYAFDGFTNLESITIADSIRKVGTKAFNSSSDLKYVFYNASEEKWNAVNKASGNTNLTEAFIHYNATDHSYGEPVTTKEPTCSENGTKKSVCAQCNAEKPDVIPALKHNFTNYTVLDDATCTNNATEIAKCDRCSVTNNREIEGTKLGHNYSEEYVIVKAPTCTESGTEGHVCARCSDAKDLQEVAPLGHEVSKEYTIDYPATCETPGQESRHCTRAHCTYHEDARSIPSNGQHRFGEYVNDDNAWCNTNATKTAICELCGESDTVEIENTALEHDYTEKIISPTCTEGGYTLHTCRRCGDNYKDNETPPSGHNFETYTSNEDATCTEDGTKTSVCTRCHKEDTISDEGTALGHDYDEKVTDPTCEKGGYTTYTCKRCEHTYDDNETDPLGHDFETYTSNEDATCTEDGTKTAKCTRCDTEDTISDEGSSLGHDYDEKVTDPTCEKGGYTTYTCKRCEHTYDGNETDPLGHNFETYTSNEDATCTEDGTKTSVCTRCDKEDTVTDEGSALGHDHQIKETTATCTEPGKIVYQCSRCDDSYTDHEVDPSGHDYIATVTSATCTSGGSTTYTCTRCNDTYTDNNAAALGHDFEDTIIEPSCERGGYTLHTCKRCSHTMTDTNTAPLGHDFEEEWHVKEQATCCDEGVEVRHCSRCDETDKRTVPTTDHTIVTIPAAIATCQRNGKTAGKKCSVCGTVIVAQKVTPKTAHKYNIYDRCTVCRSYAPYVSLAVPAMKIKSISKAKGSFTVKWVKNKKVKGYQIRYSTYPTMARNKVVSISKNKTQTKKIKGAKKTMYYVQIRAYMKIGAATKYSPWSAVKSVVTK